MAKKEWIGKPFDATMQYITERKNKGETVAGSTEDDLGDEMTDVIPSFVDKNQYTATELNQIAQKILQPDLSLQELTNRFDWEYAGTSTFLAKFRNEDYPEELKENDLYGKLTFPNSSDRSRYRKEVEPEPDEPPRPTGLLHEAKELARDNPEMSYREIADKVGYKKLTDAVQAARDVDGGYTFVRFSPLRQDILRQLKQGDVDMEGLAEKYDSSINSISSTVGNAKQHWLDDVDVPGVATEPEMEMEVETEPELETEVEAELETEVEFERRQIQPGTSNGEVQIVMPKGVAVDLIIEGKITDENRRKIVEQLVS